MNNLIGYCDYKGCRKFNGRYISSGGERYKVFGEYDSKYSYNNEISGVIIPLHMMNAFNYLVPYNLVIYVVKSSCNGSPLQRNTKYDVLEIGHTSFKYYKKIIVNMIKPGSKYISGKIYKIEGMKILSEDDDFATVEIPNAEYRQYADNSAFFMIPIKWYHEDGVTPLTGSTRGLFKITEYANEVILPTVQKQGSSATTIETSGINNWGARSNVEYKGKRGSLIYVE